MLAVKSNFNGDIRRFTIEQNVTYPALTNILRSIYQNESLSPPHDHAIKYLDDEGDFVGIVSTNDLNLACHYAATLAKPILRLAIAETNKKKPTASAEPSKPATTEAIPAELISSGLKICGKEIFLPKETVERYGPKKDHQKASEESAPLNAANLHSTPSATATPKTGQSANMTNNSDAANASSSDQAPKFSYQRFSESTRQKNTQSADLIASSVSQLGVQTAREIEDFAAEMDASLKRRIRDSESAAVHRRASQEAARLTLETTAPTLAPSTMDCDDAATQRELALSRTFDEQRREVDSIKEYHDEQGRAMAVKAKHLHDSTLLIVEQERAKLI